MVIIKNLGNVMVEKLNSGFDTFSRIPIYHLSLKIIKDTNICNNLVLHAVSQK